LLKHNRLEYGVHSQRDSLNDGYASLFTEDLLKLSERSCKLSLERTQTYQPNDNHYQPYDFVPPDLVIILQEKEDSK
jgi:hypothetical protein